MRKPIGSIHFKRSLGIAGLALFFGAGALLFADDHTPAATTRPLFDELNRETRSLFKEVAPSIVRVQMPLMPGNLRSEGAATTRLSMIDLTHHNPQAGYIVAEVTPTTNPSATEPSDSPTPGPHYILLQLHRFSPNGIGIVVDEDQHILIPRYADKEAFTGPVPVILGDGRKALATFVGSDRLTDVTVLKLQGIRTKPAAVSPEPVEAGSLLLILSLNPAANRLAVWEGWEPDFATLVRSDGQVAGFTKSGRYYCGATYMPVVEELVDHGHVRRPFLGVGVEFVPQDDPQRQTDPALGSTPALRIREVIAGSAADHAGLRDGDLILELAGEVVPDPPTFAAAIANRRGETGMVVLRNSRRVTVTVDLQVQ